MAYDLDRSAHQRSSIPDGWFRAGDLVRVSAMYWGERAFPATIREIFPGSGDNSSPDFFTTLSIEDLEEDSFIVSDGLLGIVMTNPKIRQWKMFEGFCWEKVYFSRGELGWIYAGSIRKVFDG